MSKKVWNKDKKDKKIKDLKIPLRRKSKADCTAKEHEMIYGTPDWTALQVDQDN